MKSLPDQPSGKVCAGNLPITTPVYENGFHKLGRATNDPDVVIEHLYIRISGSLGSTLDVGLDDECKRSVIDDVLLTPI